MKEIIEICFKSEGSTVATLFVIYLIFWGITNIVRAFRGK